VVELLLHPAFIKSKEPELRPELQPELRPKLSLQNKILRILKNGDFSKSAMGINGDTSHFLKVKIDKKNISFGENEFRGRLCQVNNSVIFSGKPIGSDEFHLNNQGLQKVLSRVYKERFGGLQKTINSL